MKKDSVILYTNTNTGQSIWAAGDRVYISYDDESHKSMNYSHRLIREMNDEESKDMVEAIKLLLKMHGQQV